MIIRLQALPLQPFVSVRSSLIPSKTPNLKPSPPLSHLPNTPPATTSNCGLLFREKILYLQDLNVDTRKALHLNPNFRAVPLSSLQSVEQCLSSVGIHRPAVGRIFDMLPNLLTADPQTDLYPVFDFLLNEVGIPAAHVPKSIISCPRLLNCSVADQLRPTLLFLRGLGFVGSHAIDSQTTLLLVSSVEGTLLPKVKYLQSLGFRRREVMGMVLRLPRLLTYSIEKNFMPKVAYLLEEMGGDVAELKMFPQYFAFSLEGKIKPRHRKLIEHGFSRLRLRSMLMPSDGEFSDMLVEMRLEPVKGRR